MIDINPFDGDGVDLNDAIASAAALTALGLIGRKGYTGVRLIGPETLQSYFRGNKATKTFKETPKGSALMRVLEAVDATGSTVKRGGKTNMKGRLQNYAYLTGDRRDLTETSMRQLRETGLLTPPKFMTNVRYAEGATLTSPSARGVNRKFTHSTEDPVTAQTLINSGVVTNYKTGKIVGKNFKFNPNKHAIFVRPKREYVAKLNELNEDGFEIFSDPSYYNEIVLLPRTSPFGRPLNPPVDIYPSGSSLNPETNPVYNPTTGFNRLSDPSVPIPRNQISDVDLTDQERYAQELEENIQQMGLNRQIIDRYKGLGVYRNLLERERAAGKGAIRSRISAQRAFRDIAQESTKPRRALRDNIIPEEDVESLSRSIYASKRETKARVQAAFAARSAKTTDEGATNLVKEDIKRVKEVLDRNNEAYLKAMRQDRTGTFNSSQFIPPEPIPYWVDNNYVSKVGYVKQYPPQRPADFMPSNVGSAPQQNSAMRQIAEGKNYPTKETIMEDEIRAMQGLPPIEFDPSALPMTKTRSLRRALRGLNEVVVDDLDIRSMLGGVLPTTPENFELGRMSTNIMQSGSAYDAVAREAMRRAITEGAAPMSGRDLFIQQALRDLRGISSFGDNVA